MGDTRKEKKARQSLLFYSWEDEQDKARLLREAEHRINNPQIQARKVKAIDDAARPHRRPAPPVAITKEVADEFPELLYLDDWKWRLVIWGNFNDLHIYNGERFWADYCAEYSKVVDRAKEGKHWPKGTLPRGNPYKTPHLDNVEVVQIHFDQDEGQYYFVVEKAPGVTATWWFKDEFQRSPLGPSWVRPTKVSRTRPWKGVVRKKKLKGVPFIRLSKVEKRKLKEGTAGKAFVIRCLQRRRPDVPVVTLKEFVERLLQET